MPKRSIDEKEGIIKEQEIRTLRKVRNWYTYFRENDIIFAKITPCMENGKSVIALKLWNEIGLDQLNFMY